MRTGLLLAAAWFCAVAAGPALGQSGGRARSPAMQPTPAGQADVVPGVVGVEGAAIGGTYLRVAGDLASVLNSPEMRVVPVVGQGSVQNLDDLLKLRGVDVAVVQTDALAYVQREHLLPPGAGQSIQYVAKLYDEDIHVVAGSGVRTLADLRGKAVKADMPRSGSTLTARLLFGVLGSLLHADYPNLVPEGQEVGTLAVGAALAVYSWPPGSARHGQLARFVQVLFANFDRLQPPPAHPKWREVNLAAAVPGWTRFGPVGDELARAGDRAAAEEFNRFLAAGPAAATLTPQQRAALMQQLLRWRRQGSP